MEFKIGDKIITKEWENVLFKVTDCSNGFIKADAITTNWHWMKNFNFWSEDCELANQNEVVKWVAQRVKNG